MIIGIGHFQNRCADKIIYLKTRYLALMQHCRSSPLCGLEQSPPTAIWFVGSHESDQSAWETKGTLTPKALANWSCLFQWSRISCLSKAAADVAQVAINHNPLHWSCKTPQYYLFMVSAMGKTRWNRGIQSYKWNLLYNAESRNLSKFGWINQK